MDKVLKSCPHYKQLADIFATEREAEVVVMSSSAMELDPVENVVDNLEDPQDEHDISELASGSSAARPFAKKIKANHQNTAIDRLATLEAERRSFREKQLQFEIEKFNWKRQVETNKHENEKKIEYDFQLKKMELEQNERIRKLEIEMKYNK
ncbi:uncharacterized protein LOC128920354 [Zeugodacus cucurbitae]|uniref:uncharacterized protein LOC128920354 n=1 Tax=Zeugodacus cucurbitae TaxID=28588 RepID=UPI0023D8FB42|nr:uncharacterized protein LOC128920354 [Zeugodacus cucurbitae]